MSTNFDVIVIGNGLIGSAASRYLSATGLRVAALGPAEPENWRTHQGVFSSHYDQGRITRITDPDRVWGLLAKRSIDVYAEIEAQSGIQFHMRAGQLRVSPDPTAPGDTLQRTAENGRELGAHFDWLERDQLAERFPYLNFPEHAAAIWERGGAGFINPRSLAQAQLTIAAKQGAAVIRETAMHIDQRDGRIEVITDAGNTYSASKVLVATGGYTNHLLGKRLDLRPKAVSVVLAELGAAELKRLHGLPTLIWKFPNHPLLEGIYSAPPTRYPDGRTYFKIGGGRIVPRYMHTPEEFLAHFHSDGVPDEIAALRTAMLALFPGLTVDAWQSKPCVVTYTAHDYPYVDRIDDGLFVAVGGCGSAAKSSNEIGRMAALLVEHGVWTYDVEAGVFGARFL